MLLKKEGHWEHSWDGTCIAKLYKAARRNSAGVSLKNTGSRRSKTALRAIWVLVMYH